MPSHLAGFRAKSVQDVELDAMLEANPLLQENYEAAAASLLALRSEDIGWAPLNRMEEDDGFSLKSLHEVAEHAELQTTGNPLLKRGLTLRTTNVFGRGLAFEAPEGEKVQPRFQKIMDKPGNKKVLYSQAAYAKNERSVFITGNLIMAYRVSTQTFFPIPFQEITGSASNPDLREDVEYYQRTYNPFDPATGRYSINPVTEWYPVLEKFENKGRGLPTKLGDYKVDPDVILVDFKANTSIGRIWGVPDCLPAMPYAWAHAEYIRDASKLLKALSTIAWKVVSRSKGNAQTAGAKLGVPTTRANAAVMTEGTDLVAMPRSGQVNMADGQAIAAYVASALEVSLIALLSDPGTATGSYGAAATLDGPSANSARARQAMWVDFYERIYRVVGCKDIVVNFPKIQEDPAFRVAQTLTLGFASGALWQDEYREAFLEVADVEAQHKEVPEANIFTNAAQFSLEAVAIAEKAQQADAEASQAKADNVTGQGRSSGVGKSATDHTTQNQGTQAGRGSIA